MQIVRATDGEGGTGWTASMTRMRFYRWKSYLNPAFFLMYRNRTILTIAINDYDDVHCDRLDNPVRDAQRLIKVLQERYGFGTAGELFNHQATFDNIVNKLYDISYSSDSEDVLLIFFAGHGGQHDYSKMGYWHPVDGQDPTDRMKLLWNSRILEVINLMLFKHILLISDSCYSGTFITRIPAGALPSTLDGADILESRWVLVSGGEEKVKDGRRGDGSPFMNSVCRFLENTRKRRFPATDLFTAVKNDFEDPKTQNPQASPLNSPGHNGGIMVFENSDGSDEEEINKFIGFFPLPPGPTPGHYIGRTVSPRTTQPSLTSYFGLEIDRKKLPDLLESETRIVVLGNAGSGKSRELLRLWELLDRSGGRFQPIYKRFNTYVDQPIADFLPEGWESIDPFMAVFLLDGLDEVQPQYFANAVRSLEEFANAHPDSRFVITCRTNFYELPDNKFAGTLYNFSVYELNDLSFIEIKKYVSMSRGLDGETFLEQAQQNHLMDLVQKPFFLEFLVPYFANHGVLTQQRSIIIEEAITVQLAANHQRLNATKHGRKLDNATALKILERIGFVMEQMGRNYLSDDDFQTLFPAFKDRELVRELPFFFHDDVNGRWQFEHNNIQEFLAAKVLDKLSFAKILALITIPKTNKVKPSWVNTLSFFVSIGDSSTVNALLNWLVQYERDFIMRFEPERIPDQVRLKVAIGIIEYHAKENIWFSSTIYTEQDIARIGSFSEVIHHLQTDLDNPASTITVKLNAFRVLRYMNFNNFPAEKKKFGESLLKLVLKKDTPDHFIYSAMNTLGDLQLLAQDDLDDLVTQYKNSINAYIRAGLYSLLIESGKVDSYLNVFLDGLKPDEIANPMGERNRVSLLDEQVRLVNGLSKITTSESVKKLLEHFHMPGRWRHFSREDESAIIQNIVNIATTSYPSDAGIYSIMLDATMEAAKHFDDHLCGRLSHFFLKTGTAHDALKTVLDDSSDYLKGQLIPVLIEPGMIATLIDQLKAQQLTEDQVRQIHSALAWYKRSYGKGADLLKSLEQGLLQATGLDLREPDLPVVPPSRKTDPHVYIDLLFDKERFKHGLRDYYKRVGKDAISWEEVVNSRAQNRNDFSSDSPVFTFISDYFHGQLEHPLTSTLEFIDSPRFDNWAMGQVHRKLEEDTDSPITLSGEQVKIVKQWVERTIGQVNIPFAIDHSDDIVRVLWHFILRFDISLPPEKLLSFTLYYDFKSKVGLADEGTIDKLEKLIPKDKLLETVGENLHASGLSVLPWLNNASYAIIHQMRGSYPAIVKYLVEARESEYKFEQLLELWAKQADGFAQITNVAEAAANTSLRLSALEIMAKNPSLKKDTSNLLAVMLADEQLEMHPRLEAAKQLIKLDDARGVAFIADRIETARIDGNRYDHGVLQSLTSIKTLDALPHLLRLTAFALRPDVRSQDDIGYFFSPILEGLFNPGMQSAAALAEVDKQVTAFIAQNEGKLVDLEVLKVNLRRLHERFNATNAQPLTLRDAIEQYERIS
jgi:hypothetical protein